jgi:hypothetical protein
MFAALLKPDNKRFPEKEVINHADPNAEYVKDKTA